LDGIPRSQRSDIPGMRIPLSLTVHFIGIAQFPTNASPEYRNPPKRSTKTGE
jgi:hypothetical protein